MAKRAKRLQKLVELAALEERRESAEVGRSQLELRAAKQRLEELGRYRSDYRGHGTPTTVGAFQWGDYQAFLGRMDEALAAQQALILDGEKSVAAHRRRWMAKRQRLNSLERVLDRCEREDALQEDRIEQKRLDDLKLRTDWFDPD